MDALDTLITRCQEAATDPDPAQAVRTVVAGSDLVFVLEAIRARPQPWFFTAGPSLTVFATEGRPGSGSAPHDHGLWAVIACLAGREGSRRYRVVDGRLLEDGISAIEAAGVHALPSEAIHAVFNCWHEPNVVLHCYGGDFLAAPKRVWDPITGSCAPLGLSEPLAPSDGVR